MAQDAYSISKSLECPVCLEFLQKPIRQCVIGHSFCTKCIDPNNIKKCPECRSDILETRNYKLEELLDTVSLPCINKEHGCPYVLEKELLQLHIEECRHRKMKCGGKIFCNWNCTWEGYDLLEHFKSKHASNSTMEYTSQISVAYNNQKNFTDIHLIPAHYQLFWYKHKIDIDKKKAFWCIQYIGPKKQAAYYYYEFELFVQNDPVRKYKITEYCQSDVEKTDGIFESEKCVAITLNALKTYVGENGEFSFRFRIMKLKKEDPANKKTEQKTAVTKSKTGAPLQKATKSNNRQPPTSPQQQDWIPWLPVPTPIQPSPFPQMRRPRQ